MTAAPRRTSVRLARSVTAQRTVGWNVPARTARPRRRRSAQSPVRQQGSGAGISRGCLLPLSGFSTRGPRFPAAAHTSSGDTTGEICRRRDRHRSRRRIADAPGSTAPTWLTRHGRGGGGCSDRFLCGQPIGHGTSIIARAITRRSATRHGDRTPHRAHHLGRTAGPADGQLGGGRGPAGRDPGDS